MSDKKHYLVFLDDILEAIERYSGGEAEDIEDPEVSVRVLTYSF